MRKPLSLLVVALAFASCAANRYMASDIPPAEITDLTKVETISRIHLISKGNRPVLSDSLSDGVRVMLDSALRAGTPVALLPGEIALADTDEVITVQNDLTILAELAAGGRNKKSPIFLTHSIDSLLTAQGVRYAMLVVHDGFTRTGGNYAGQIAKGMGLGILTAVASMGMVSVYFVPHKAASTVQVFIVDGERKQVVFYNKSFFRNEPVKQRTLSNHVENIFHKYNR